MTVLRTPLAFGIAAVAAGVLAAPSSLAQPATTTKPTITVRPSRVMVSSPTTVSGAGFPANSLLKLRECGRTFWLVPEEPCNTSNAITVKTDRYGHFKATFHVELCPEGKVGKGPTERTCYIGRVQFGEDTGELQPAARISVTYP
jgi:hypothetical protein